MLVQQEKQPVCSHECLLQGVILRGDSKVCHRCKQGTPERFVIQITHPCGEGEIFSFEELALHNFKAAPRHVRVLRFQPGKAYSQEIISSACHD